MAGTLTVDNISGGIVTVDNANTDTIAGKSNANNMTINAGNITIKGEGSATTNLQQGLVKAWFNLNSDDNYRDSFNITNFTDNGTGDFSHNFTNAMNNDDFSFTTGTNGSNSQSGVNSYNMYYEAASTGTGFVRSQNISSGGTGLDNAYVMGMVAGDLA